MFNGCYCKYFERVNYRSDIWVVLSFSTVAILTRVPGSLREFSFGNKMYCNRHLLTWRPCIEHMKLYATPSFLNCVN